MPILLECRLVDLPASDRPEPTVPRQIAEILAVVDATEEHKLTRAIGHHSAVGKAGAIALARKHCLDLLGLSVAETLQFRNLAEPNPRGQFDDFAALFAD